MYCMLVHVCLCACMCACACVCTCVHAFVKAQERATVGHSVEKGPSYHHAMLFLASEKGARKVPYPE